ncbi:hypothetical protein KAV47_05225, partial [Candidatus Bathyarchaeota archaeon]|nr:hypothetical protein [Candidatus Bathyarchaeota archaeon]
APLVVVSMLVAIMVSTLGVWATSSSFNPGHLYG